MKVKDIMTTSVEAIRPDFTLRQAARKMGELKVGSLLITEEDKILGIITDRDVACFAVAMGHDANSTPVQKVMTKEVTTCLAEQGIDEAAKLMESKALRRLVVMNGDNSMAGFLSVDDLARHSKELAGEVLKAAIPAH